MNYAFALKILGWNKIYTTRNFVVSPITDGIYGPILDSNIGVKGVLATDYLPLLDPSFIKYEMELDPVTQEMQSTPASFRLYGDEKLIEEIVQITGPEAELVGNIPAPTAEAYLGSINVKSRGNLFPLGSQFIQIGQETWKVDARVGNTFTVSQRGCFGSFQEKSVNVINNPVYVTPIRLGQAGKGVELWLQTFGDNGEVLSLNTIWKGFIEYTRLTDNQYIEIVCRDSFSYLKNNSVNIHMLVPTTARSYGFDRRIVSWYLNKYLQLGDGLPRRHQVLALPININEVEYYNSTNITRKDFLDSIGKSIRNEFQLHGVPFSDSNAFYYGHHNNGASEEDGKLKLELLFKDSLPGFSDGSMLKYWFGTETKEIQPTPTKLGVGLEDYHVNTLEFDAKKFNSIQVLKESEGTENRLHTVNNTFNSAVMDHLIEEGSLETALINNIAKTEAKIPDSIKIYENIDKLHVWMKLRGKYPDNLIENQPVTIYGPVYMDYISYVETSRTTNYVNVFDEGLSWEYGTLIESKNYISGLYHGYWKNYKRLFVSNIENLCSNVVLPIETDRPLFRRFDIPSNTKTLGEELADQMLFFDYYFTYDSFGNITVRNFADDLSQIVNFTDITSNDILEKPNFSQDSALVNQVTIKSNGFLNSNNAINITDYFSIKKYGGKKAKEIDLTGTIFEFRYFADTDHFNKILMERYLRRFSGIRNIVEVKVPINFYTVEIGSTVKLTDWITPNQLGKIGSSGEFYTVIKKEVNWSEGTVTLTLVLFPFYKMEQGNIVPCARVANIVGADIILANGVMDTAGTMTDYSWSNNPLYPNTIGDRGVGYFSQGYKVRLTNRNTFNWYSEEFEVLSVNPALYKVTLTTPPSSYWTTALSNGSIIDIHYSIANNIPPIQYPFSYIGNTTTGYVDSSLINPNKKWRSS